MQQYFHSSTLQSVQGTAVQILNNLKSSLKQWRYNLQTITKILVNKPVESRITAYRQVYGS